jgi:hypothetical protein
MRARRRWWRRWGDQGGDEAVLFILGALALVIGVTILLNALLPAPACARHTTDQRAAVTCRR